MCLPRVVVPPPHSMPVTGWCNLFKKVWRDTLKLSPWHIKALEAMPIDWISPPETNRPFDSAIRYPVGSKERLACSATSTGLLRRITPSLVRSSWVSRLYLSSVYQSTLVSRIWLDLPVTRLLSWLQLCGINTSVLRSFGQCRSSLGRAVYPGSNVQGYVQFRLFRSTSSGHLATYTDHLI